ncbi:MAG: elongation factor Ts [Alphaproteobacteria bacterium]|nr:elongation factor Ts [Alphaproteobacteria bacterium]
MSTISATMVKDLREKTGAGMMDCKSALTETGGDIEAAVDWLRKKGLAKAAKKAGRTAAEGLVGIAIAGTAGAMVEVNSETDFVARNPDFQASVAELAQVALSVNGEIEALRVARVPSSGKSAEAHVTDLVARIGENMALRRSAGIKVSQGAVAGYVHTQAAPGLGRIGVIVGLQSAADPAALEELGRRIAMHIAASSPLSVDEKGVPADVAERERAVLIEQARQSGKPEAIIEKMAEGRMRKFYEEVALLKQPFVMKPDQSVESLLAEEAKTLGAPITVTGFARFTLGEGIEKEEQDFAAEVQAAARSS